MSQGRGRSTSKGWRATREGGENDTFRRPAAGAARLGSIYLLLTEYWLSDSAPLQRRFSAQAELDSGQYPTGVTVTKSEMDAIALVPDEFHGDWNYKLVPR